MHDIIFWNFPSCVSGDTGVQRSKINTVWGWGWLDGLFTDELCTGAVICELLWQLVLKASEGDMSLQLQRFLQFWFVGVQILQLFQIISYLDLGEGEVGKVWAICCGEHRAVDRGSGSQVESMASRRKMLIEILNYCGFIGGNSVS